MKRKATADGQIGQCEGVTPHCRHIVEHTSVTWSWIHALGCESGGHLQVTVVVMIAIEFTTVGHQFDSYNMR